MSRVFEQALAPSLAPQGVLFPESFLDNPVVSVLAAFVAINTLVYVVLAAGKILPKLYVSDFINRRNRRSETRSIDPDAPI